MVKMINIANGRKYELSENQKNIVFMKIAEIMEKWEQETQELRFLW